MLASFLRFGMLVMFFIQMRNHSALVRETWGKHWVESSFFVIYVNKGSVMHDKVDGSEIPNNHLGCFWNPVNNVINYQPQLVLAGFLPSTVFLYVYTCCNATLTQQESDFLWGSLFTFLNFTVASTGTGSIPGYITQCMVYLPTCSIKINQMLVNIPYIKCLG